MPAWVETLAVLIGDFLTGAACKTTPLFLRSELYEESSGLCMRHTMAATALVATGLMGALKHSIIFEN